MIYYQQMIIKKLLGHRPLFFLVVISTGAIAWASLAKLVVPTGIKIHGSDKLAHCIVYFVLTLVWFCFFFFSEKLNKNLKQSLAIASVVAILYGILMEVLQAMLTTYRSSDWYDIAANTTGTIFAIMIVMLIKRKINKVKLNVQVFR